MEDKLKAALILIIAAVFFAGLPCSVAALCLTCTVPEKSFTKTVIAIIAIVEMVVCIINM